MAAKSEIFPNSLRWEALYQESTRIYARHLENQQSREAYGRLAWLLGSLPPLAWLLVCLYPELRLQWLGSENWFLPSLLLGALVVAWAYAVIYRFFPDLVQDPDRLLASQYLVGLLRHDGGSKDRVRCWLDQRDYTACPHPRRAEKAAEGKFGPWKYYRQTWLRMRGGMGFGHQLELKLQRWRRERSYLKRSGTRYKIEVRDEIQIRLRRTQPFPEGLPLRLGQPPEGWEMTRCQVEAGELSLWLRSINFVAVPSFHQSVRKIPVCLVWVFRCLYGPQNLQRTDTALLPT